MVWIEHASDLDIGLDAEEFVSAMSYFTYYAIAVVGVSQGLIPNDDFEYLDKILNRFMSDSVRKPERERLFYISKSKKKDKCAITLEFTISLFLDVLCTLLVLTIWREEQKTRCIEQYFVEDDEKIEEIEERIEFLQNCNESFVVWWGDEERGEESK